MTAPTAAALAQRWREALAAATKKVEDGYTGTALVIVTFAGDAMAAALDALAARPVPHSEALPMPSEADIELVGFALYLSEKPGPHSHEVDGGFDKGDHPRRARYIALARTAAKVFADLRKKNAAYAVDFGAAPQAGDAPSETGQPEGGTMDADQAMEWLDARVNEGRGAVVLGGNDFDGSPSVFMGDSEKATGTGDTVLEAVQEAAQHWKGWPR